MDKVQQIAVGVLPAGLVVVHCAPHACAAVIALFRPAAALLILPQKGVYCLLVIHAIPDQDLLPLKGSCFAAFPAMDAENSKQQRQGDPAPGRPQPDRFPFGQHKPAGPGRRQSQHSQHGQQALSFVQPSGLLAELLPFFQVGLHPLLRLPGGLAGKGSLLKGDLRLNIVLLGLLQLLLPPGDLLIQYLQVGQIVLGVQQRPLLRLGTEAGKLPLQGG